METTTMTVRLSVETKEKLAQLAKDVHRSKSYLAAIAIEEYVEHESRMVASIKQGLDDVEKGRVVDHDEVMRMLGIADED